MLSEESDMERTFELFEITRKNILGVIEGLTSEQLNHTPAGFSNNIIWNMAHMVVTQQLLCYGLSNNKMNIDESLVDKYRKGTKPTGSVDQEEIDFWTAQLVESFDQLRQDYEDCIFKEFKPYPTSYNFELHSIEDAIAFINVHDTLHLGYIMALKRSLSKISDS